MYPRLVGVCFSFGVEETRSASDAGVRSISNYRMLAAGLASFSVFTTLAFQARGDVPDVSQILELLGPSVYSFDVFVECKERSMVNLTRENGEPIDSINPHSLRDLGPIKTTIVDEKDAVERSYSYRQTFSYKPNDRVPLRRLEEFDTKTGATLSLLAFDGSIRRSLYFGKNLTNGLIGGPTDEQFAFWARDYLVLLGFTDQKRRMSLEEAATDVPLESIEIREESPSTAMIHIPPKAKSNASYYGYRVWLRRDKGWAIEKWEQYSYVPTLAEPGAHRVPSVSRQIVVDEFQPIDDSKWVPRRAVIKQFMDRGPSRGSVTNKTEVTVDVQRSRWNVDLPNAQFAFEFPSGTTVDDMLVGITLTVGDRPAGRDVDQLVAEGKNKFPHSRDAKSLEAAGWISKETVAAKFRNEQSLSERLTNRLRDARLGNQRALMVIGDPANPLIYQFYLSEGEDELSKATYNYLFLPVDTTVVQQLEATKRFVAELGISWPAANDAAFAVLDEQGKFVAEASCRELAVDGKVDQSKLFSFLKAHGPEFPDAEQLLAGALVQAKREGNRVLVQESGPRCSPCIRLSRYFDDLHGLLDKEFVLIRLDSRFEHGDAVIGRLRQGQSSGIPWMAILDADGHLIISSDGPNGNIGYPENEAGRIQFEKMLRTAPRHLTDDDIKSLLAPLAEKSN